VDLYLNPSTKNLVIENGDFVTVLDLEAYKQQLSIRFKFFRGQWYLDKEEGSPWVDRVFSRLSRNEIKPMIFKIIKTTPGTSSVESLILKENRQTRTLSIEATIQTIFGEAKINSNDERLII